MNYPTCIGLTAIALLLVCATAATAGDGLTLTVRAKGASPGTGYMVFTLFNSERRFLKDPLIGRTLPVDSSGQAVLQFDGLKSGAYAVNVYYDQDGNGKLNTGLFGIPSELVGFSNNAKGLFGPPSFSKAAFVMSEDRAVEIRLGKAKE